MKAQLIASCKAFKTAQAAQWAADEAAGVEATKAPLQAEEISNIDVSDASTELSSLRNVTVDLIDQLAQSNPTPAPFDGWRDGGGSKLSGRWNLLFTTGADATFRPSKDKGTATTFQVSAATANHQPPPPPPPPPPPLPPPPPAARRASSQWRRTGNRSRCLRAPPAWRR